MVRFEVPENLQGQYERIRRRFARQGHILAILECPDSVFLLSDEQKLARYGLRDYTTLRYLAKTYDKNAPGDEQIAGRAVQLSGPKGRVSAIFLREQYQGFDNPTYFWVCKLGVLYHELGHADDFRQGINFNHRKMIYKPKEGEEYADRFAKKYLSRIPCVKFLDDKPEKSNLWEVYGAIRYQGKFA
jgi:hypothetical protein